MASKASIPSSVGQFFSKNTRHKCKKQILDYGHSHAEYKKKCNLIYPFGKLRMLLFEMIPFFHPPVHHVSHLLICAPAPMTGFLYPHSTTFLFIFEFFCTTCTFHNTTDKKETTDECSPPVVSSLMHYTSSCFCFSYFFIT